MGFGVTYDELAAMLTPVGLTIVLPGEPDKALPCISIEPTAITLVPGVRVGWESANVNVRYPLAINNVSQFAKCNESAYKVLRALLGTNVLVGDQTPLFGDADNSTPAFRYQIEVSFPGPHDICNT